MGLAEFFQRRSKRRDNPKPLSTTSTTKAVPAPLGVQSPNVVDLSLTYPSEQSPTTPDMPSSTPPAADSSSSAMAPTSLAFLVLLPTTQSSQDSHQRPPPLTHRQSGSVLPSLSTLSPTDSTDRPQGATDAILSQRRLSLAPGIGAGLSAGTSTPLKAYNDTESATLTESPSHPQSPQSAHHPPPFGAKSPSSTSGGPVRSSRRPQTSSSDRASPGPYRHLGGGGPRGSVAFTGRSNILGGGGRARPGWEGDEVVNVLRSSGLEVTILRNAAQIPSILSPTSSSAYAALNQQTITARPSTPSSVTHVVLVPLSDPQSNPSLSLLLQQRTTPTAVCFQQDLLDRAKRSEETWLPGALKEIQTVSEMRDQAQERPIVIAYSASPVLSPNTIAACVSAGASGVLKPPFDAETARLVRRMVRAAREGRISSVVGLPSHHGTPARVVSPTHLEDSDDEVDRRVILPPTALSMGGEHEGEKVLSGAYRSSHHHSNSHSSPASEADVQASMSNSASAQSVAVANAFSDHHVLDHDHETFATLLAWNPIFEQRRRSVDVAGLCNALHRAQRAFEAGKPALTADPIRDLGFHTKDEESHCDLKCCDTQLAELLSAMYYQTMVAIDVQMDGYEELIQSLPSRREELIHALATWDFKPHLLDDGDLFLVATILFDSLLRAEGLVDLEIDSDQINRLLFAIRAIYHAPNPYHNYVHAIDVLQATYTFLISLGVAPPFEYIRTLTPNSPPWKRPAAHGSSPGSKRARQVFRPQDVLAILVAAMGHDAGHPGLSNAFMKNAKTPLSQVYDDKSVLENMHCMLIVQLLRKHGFGFLIDPPRHSAISPIAARAAIDTKGFRHVLYSAILATDMSLHFAWMQELQNLGSRIQAGTGFYAPAELELHAAGADDTSAEPDRVLISQSLIKCADISNPTRPIDVSTHWSTVLLKEWAVQASLETDLELPVSVIASADAALQAKGQIGFIKLFTQPLFDAVSNVVGEMQTYAEKCAENHRIWTERLAEFEKSSESDIVQPVVEDAAYDDRFATLFPLSLPSSLVEAHSLEPGPVPIIAVQSLISSSSQPTTQVTAGGVVIPQKNKVPTDASSCSPHPGSPAAKAMRAVYHGNLLAHRNWLSNWRDGPNQHVLASQTIITARRSSTPGVLG